MPEWTLQTLMPWAVALAALLCVCLLALLLRANRRQRRLERNLYTAYEQIADALERLRSEQNARLSDWQRSVPQMGDMLLGAVNAATRAHGEQVDALIRQSQSAAQMTESRMQASEAAIARALSQNEARMEALRKAVEDGMRAQREESAQQLAQIRRTVDEKLTESLDKRLTESFGQVSQRLEKVYQSLGEMNTLATGVGDLKRMLGNVKTRGVWGEVQLGALLAQVLTDTQYARNVAVQPGSQERVEFAVVLPGKGEGERPVYLPIDSKFPQEDYARLAEASQSGDQQAVEACQKALLAAVRAEAKRIGKYIVPPYTTDFAVMFLPLESLYAEVMRHSELVEALQREQRILISGPSTLLALLNSLQMGFRTLAIEQRSAEVWKLLGAVKGDFASFAQVLERTQDKLRQATDSIETAFTRTRTIQKRLRDVETMDMPAPEALPEGAAPDEA